MDVRKGFSPATGGAHLPADLAAADAGIQLSLSMGSQGIKAASSLMQSAAALLPAPTWWLGGFWAFCWEG